MFEDMAPVKRHGSTWPCSLEDFQSKIVLTRGNRSQGRRIVLRNFSVEIAKQSSKKGSSSRKYLCSNGQTMNQQLVLLKLEMTLYLEVAQQFDSGLSMN